MMESVERNARGIFFVYKGYKRCLRAFKPWQASEEDMVGD
jgi:hypothetical protein